MENNVPESSLQLVWFNGFVVPISSVQDEDERAELLDL